MSLSQNLHSPKTSPPCLRGVQRLQTSGLSSTPAKVFTDPPISWPQWPRLLSWAGLPQHWGVTSKSWDSSSRHGGVGGAWDNLDIWVTEGYDFGKSLVGQGWIDRDVLIGIVSVLFCCGRADWVLAIQLISSTVIVLEPFNTFCCFSVFFLASGPIY